MARRNFFEIINNSPVNLKAEYNRIYTLFFKGTAYDEAVVDIVDEVFETLPTHLRGRTISLSDFDSTYNFSFSENPLFFDCDDLISLCEYVWNLCKGVLRFAHHLISESNCQNIEHLLKVVDACIKDLQYMAVKQENVFIFVPQNATVVAVTEIVKEEIALSVLEYHHYGLKGNLAKKKAILKLLADEIEPKRKILNAHNLSGLGDLLFQMLQKFVRHNNDKNEHISNMSAEETESCYDDIYQLWLLAELEIDNIERKQRVKKLLGDINSPTM